MMEWRYNFYVTVTLLTLTNHDRLQVTGKSVGQETLWVVKYGSDCKILVFCKLFGYRYFIKPLNNLSANSKDIVTCKSLEYK